MKRRILGLIACGLLSSGAQAATVSRDVLWKPQFHFYDEDVRDLFDDNRQFHVSWLGLPSFSVPEDPQWTEDPFLSISWEFYYHSLGWLFGLAYGHDQDPGQQYLDDALFLIEDWIDDNPRGGSPSGMAWYDHAVAYRAAVFAFFYNEYSEFMSASLQTKLLASIQDHGDELTVLFDASQWDDHNHGMFHALALYNQAKVFDGFAEAPTWEADGKARFFEVLGGMVNVDEGVSNEQAAAYQYNVIQLIYEGQQLFEGFGEPDADSLRDILVEMVAFAALLPYPDQTLPAYGDTNYATSRAWQLARFVDQYGLGSPTTDFVRSFGASGTPPPAAIFKPQSGYAIFRPRYSVGQSAWENDVMVFVDASPAPVSHGHYDAMSFTYFNRGAKFFVDPGGPFIYGADRADFARSAAHNVVVIDDIQTPTSSAAITQTHDSEFMSFVTAEQQIDSVLFKRSVVLLKNAGVALIVDDLIPGDGDAHTYELYHHFAPQTQVTLTPDGYDLLAANGAGVRVSVMTTGVPLVTQIEGQETPHLEGWVTPILGTREPAPLVKTTIAGAGQQQFVTVIQPVNARIFDYTGVVTDCDAFACELLGLAVSDPVTGFIDVDGAASGPNSTFSETDIVDFQFIAGDSIAESAVGSLGTTSLTTDSDGEIASGFLAFDTSVDTGNGIAVIDITIDASANTFIATTDFLGLGEIAAGTLQFMLVRDSDSDGDGIFDSIDNCTLIANPFPIDTDADGFGNSCDADLNNDGIVNSLDLGLFKARLLTSDPNADMNGDGIVNSLDLGLFKDLFLQPPGPSGLVP